MLTYTFSRREKFLIGLFIVLLMAIGWYQLIYVNTTDQIRALDAKIDTVNGEIRASETKIAKKKEMEQIIDQKIKEGAKPTPIPDFDNIKPLMSELDTIMAQTDSYTLSFESLDTESSEYVLRGVGMHFGCDSYESADKMARAVAEGKFPCIIDEVDIFTGKMSSSQSGGSKVKSTFHVVFYERRPKGTH